ncbi:hypothetical protein FYE33_21325, partial [Salmonella enterica]|nr:hypothetical protein [Salmonella enterica]
MISIKKHQLLNADWFIQKIEVDSDFLSPGFFYEDDKIIDRYMDGFITLHCNLDKGEPEENRAQLVLYWECDSFEDGSFDTRIALNETVVIQNVTVTDDSDNVIDTTNKEL